MKNGRNTSRWSSQNIVDDIPLTYQGGYAFYPHFVKTGNYDVFQIFIQANIRVHC